MIEYLIATQSKMEAITRSKAQNSTIYIDKDLAKYITKCSCLRFAGITGLK